MTDCCFSDQCHERTQRINLAPVVSALILPLGVLELLTTCPRSCGKSFKSPVLKSQSDPQTPGFKIAPTGASFQFLCSCSSVIA